MDGSHDADALELQAARAAAGDEVAFHRLVHAVRPRLLRWALVQTADADEAEDVVQAALLRLQRGLASRRGDARFTTWLFTVLRSAAADWRRVQRRSREREARYARELPQATSAPERADRERLLALLRGHLGGLPGRQREILDLVDLQGHAPAAAAELLGMNPNTLRVHLLRARRTLRARLVAEHATLVEDA